MGTSYPLNRFLGWGKRMLTFFIKPASLIAKFFIALLIGLRPLLGPSACKFTVGCTQYAVMQLTEKPLFAALWAIAKRVLSCNPFNRSGFYQ